jgi:beta-glucosidase
VVNQGIATVFSQAIGLAATFDEPLVHRMATAISTQARATFHENERRGDLSRDSEI